MQPESSDTSPLRATAFVMILTSVKRVKKGCREEERQREEIWGSFSCKSKPRICGNANKRHGQVARGGMGSLVFFPSNLPPGCLDQHTSQVKPVCLLSNAVSRQVFGSPLKTLPLLMPLLHKNSGTTSIQICGSDPGFLAILR
jgi:hypothetical protein